LSTLGSFGIYEASYSKAVDTLGLALVQGYEGSPPPGHPAAGTIELGDGQTMEVFVVEPGEGDGLRFNALQPSYEDVQGALTLLSKKNSILTNGFLSALLMVDPWNPVYSWRRGVLMQYVPDTTKLPGPHDPKSNPPQRYDLEAAMEARVRNSPKFSVPGSPEQEFIVNLEAVRAGTANFKQEMDDYLTKIRDRLADTEQSDAAVIEYMNLAESRRRIYRPVPLDEFDLTLPWAVKWSNSAARFEMTKEGVVVAMDRRGKKFFHDWIASLASLDPQMIPRPDAEDIEGSAAYEFASLSLTQSTTRAASVSCQGSTALTARKMQCPALASRRTRRVTVKSIKVQPSQESSGLCPVQNAKQTSEH
jgi:hypothetical protein